MKRALLVIVAALVVLLVYPSSQTIAETNQLALGHAGTITSATGGTIPPVGTADENDGDADGVAGKSLRTPGGQQTLTDGLDTTRVVLNLWWRFLVWMR